jgi:hypothetical protein
MSQQIPTEPFLPQRDLDLRSFMVEGQTDLDLAAKAKKPATKKGKKGTSKTAALNAAPPPRNTAWVSIKQRTGLGLAPPPRGSVWVSQKTET